MDKLSPKAIIFDLGSTLIEYEVIPWDELSDLCVGEARKHLIKKKLTVPDEEVFLSTFDRIRQKYRDQAARSHVEWDVPQVAGNLLTELKIEHDDKVIDSFFDAYYAPVAKQLYVFDDTVETLRRVREEYDTVGLISNTVFPERAHIAELERFEISEFFDFKIFSSTFGVRKPHPDIFIKAANLAGLSPSECLYIGDRYLEDVQGPNGVGMPAILKVKPDREYPADMPDDVRRIDTLSEIFDHLENKQ